MALNINKFNNIELATCLQLIQDQQSEFKTPLDISKKFVKYIAGHNVFNSIEFIQKGKAIASTMEGMTLATIFTYYIPHMIALYQELADRY